MSDDHYNHGRANGQSPYGLYPGSQAHMDAMRGVREHQEQQRRLDRSPGSTDAAAVPNGPSVAQEIRLRQQTNRDAAHAACFNDGHQAGYDEGWSAGTARASEEIRKQMALAREHIADKEAMAQQLAEQHALIELLKTQIDEMKHENGGLEMANDALLRSLSPVRRPGERLQAHVDQLDGSYTTFAHSYNVHVWRHHRSMAMPATACLKPEPLATVSHAPAGHVQETCSRKYGESLSRALATGAIRMPSKRKDGLAKTRPERATLTLTR